MCASRSVRQRLAKDPADRDTLHAAFLSATTQVPGKPAARTEVSRQSLHKTSWILERLTDVASCPAGYYCTDASCCPNGTPLAECGATVSLSVVPPPASSPSSPLSHSIHSTAPTPSDTSAPEASYTTTSKVPTIGTPTATTSYTLPTGTQKPPSNGTVTTTKPSAQATAGAGRPGTNILAAFGGLGVFIAVL